MRIGFASGNATATRFALSIVVALGIGFWTNAVSDAAASEPTSGKWWGVSGIERTGRVNSTILESEPFRKLDVQVRQSATDRFGFTYTIDSTIPGYDPAPAVALIDQILHGGELAFLRVHAVSTPEVTAICGPQAAACYLADDPYTSYGGQIWFSPQMENWQVILIHEYGHHFDNSLSNLSHLRRWGFGLGCDAGSDGSRNWFFERLIADDVLNRGFSCDPNSEWDLLLPELFAEDYSSLNGVTGWILPRIPAPTTTQLDAMLDDFKYGLKTKLFTWKSRVKKRKMKFRPITLPNWTFLRIRLYGPARSDFDLFVYTNNGTRPIRSTRRRGRNDSMLTFLPPGKYILGVYAYGGKGAFRASIGQL